MYHNGDGKKEANKYYIANKNVLKEKAKNKYRNLCEEEREAKRKYRRNRYRDKEKKYGLKEY